MKYFDILIFRVWVSIQRQSDTLDMFNGWVGAHTLKYLEKNLSKSFMLGTPTHPSELSKVSPCHCTCTHPPTNSYNVKIFHFMNTHPPIQHTESVTLSLHTYPPTHEHVKIFHFRNTHPPIKHIQSITLSKFITVHITTHPQNTLKQL